MEYLMTYGWAILIIAVVLGVLFQLGVFSGSALAPKAQPGSCQVQRLLGQVSLEGLCQGQLPQFVMSQAGGTSAGNVLVKSLASFSTQTFTLSYWIKISIVPSGYWRIIDKGEGDSLGGFTCSVNSGAVSVICGVYDGSLKHEWVSSTLSLNTWYNIVLTYNGLTVGEFINGTNKGGTTGSMVTDTVPLGIGGDVSVPTNGGFPGSLANVQLYNATLSASEIQGLYQEGIGGTPVKLNNLVGWWPLNGDTKDYSGNNNNGQINEGISFNSTWNSQYTPP